MAVLLDTFVLQREGNKAVETVNMQRNVLCLYKKTLAMNVASDFFL